MASPAVNGAEVEPRDLSLIDVSENTRENAAIIREIRRALAKTNEYRLQDIHAVLNAGAEEEAQNNITTAQAFFKAGLVALDNGSAFDAAEQFDSAARMIEQDFAVLRNPEVYRKLLLYLGVAFFRAEELEDAKDAFRRAAIAKAKPDLIMLKERELALFDAAVAAVQAGPFGGFRVETDPPNAEVYVDGRFRGITPTTIAGLTVSPHVIAVKKDGYTRSTQRLVVSKTELLSITATLDPARRKPQFDALKQRILADLKMTGADIIHEGIRMAGALLFSELAIVAHITGEPTTKHIALYLFDIASQKLLLRQEVDVDWSKRNRLAIIKLMSGFTQIDYTEALAANMPQTKSPSASGADDSVLGKWWFWTIIGASVAGGATAAILLTMDDGPPPEPAPTTGSVLVRF
jgi:tetratricopeptide (TPR) repeat protein